MAIENTINQSSNSKRKCFRSWGTENITKNQQQKIFSILAIENTSTIKNTKASPNIFDIVGDSRQNSHLHCTAEHTVQLAKPTKMATGLLTLK